MAHQHVHHMFIILEGAGLEQEFVAASNLEIEAPVNAGTCCKLIDVCMYGWEAWP